VSQKRALERKKVHALYLIVKRTRGGSPSQQPENKAIEDARMVLVHATTVDLPALENAIKARDFDLALTCATALRAARALIRGQLGGGDIAGILRAEWNKVEARLDAVLLLAPRADKDIEAARAQWKQRLARGTEPATTSRRGGVRAKGSKPAMDEQPTLDAISSALDAEVYFAPRSPTVPPPGRSARTTAPAPPPADFDNEPTEPDPPTIKRKRRPSR
jgi:hypothetical protein